MRFYTADLFEGDVLSPTRPLHLRERKQISLTSLLDICIDVSVYTHHDEERTGLEFHGKLRVLQPALGVARPVAFLCLGVEPSRPAAHPDAHPRFARRQAGSEHGRSQRLARHGSHDARAQSASAGKGRGHKVSLVLTAKGRAALQKFLPDWQVAQQKVIKTLGKERWTEILRDLERAALALN